jgi:hypothetical protein
VCGVIKTSRAADLSRVPLYIYHPRPYKQKLCNYLRAQELNRLA